MQHSMRSVCSPDLKLGGIDFGSQTPSALSCIFLAVFQFSTYFPGYFDGQYWLWWVFLVLGECLGGERCLKTLKSVGIL